MEKGKLGLRLSFYGVTAFILAFLGQTTLLCLLAGVALIVEKNEWASRQVLQALCLCLVASLISNVLGVVDFIYDIPVISTIWSTIIGIVNSVVDVIVLVFCIVGLARNVSGKEADIPLASNFANWAFGIINQNQQFNQAQNFNQSQQFNQAQNFNQNQQFNQAQNFNQNQQPNQAQNFNQNQQPNAAAPQNQPNQQ